MSCFCKLKKIMNMKIKLVVMAMVFITSFINIDLKQTFATESERQAEELRAEMSVDSQEAAVREGEEVDILLTVSSDIEMGDIEGMLLYDEELLQFVSADKGINGGDGFLKLSLIGVQQGYLEKEFLISFTALASGKATIELSKDTRAYSFDNGESILAGGPVVLTFDILPNAEGSADTTLSSFKISPGSLEPEYSDEVDEYHVSVGADTKRLIISAITNDPAARVSVEGSDTLDEEENYVYVTVVAENGVRRTITLVVKKENVEPVTTTTVEFTTSGTQIVTRPVEEVTTKNTTKVPETTVQISTEETQPVTTMAERDPDIETKEDIEAKDKVSRLSKVITALIIALIICVAALVVLIFKRRRDR